MKALIIVITSGIITAMLVVFHLTSKNQVDTVTKVPPFLRTDCKEKVVFPSKDPQEYPLEVSVLETRPPFLGKSYIAFKEALGFRESSGNYFVVNNLGYLGKYQFGPGTLQVIGLSNTQRFLNEPKLQEKAFHTNISRNKWILRKDLQRFNGKFIDGIRITESGILAAAHLAGAGNVKKYLRSYGSFDFEDAYGTSIKEYMFRFSGFDVSPIEAKRNPRVSIG